MNEPRLDERAEKQVTIQDAEAHGIDLSLLDDNLLLTPEERLRQHCRALQLALDLRRAAELLRARS